MRPIRKLPRLVLVAYNAYSRLDAGYAALPKLREVFDLPLRP